MEREREVVPPRLIRVPDVVGLPVKKARLLLQQAGLLVDSVLYRESYEERDTVLEQRPRRGEMVYSGSPTTVTVSRESYVRWLPGIYQRTDPTGRNMVRDLLWIVQHLLGSIDDQLETIHEIFDSYETRVEFLPWLAAWSAMFLEPDWPTEKKRRLIKKAMELYAMRGTVRGLQLFISLFTGFEPRLEENVWPFQGCRVGVSSAIGIDTVVLPQVDKANAFVVVMPKRFSEVSPEAVIRLHEIIEMEKPANTTYMLKFEDPSQSVEEREYFEIGVRSGINIGEEIVTPLPVSPETGEPEYPKYQVEPAPPPDPSVFELFGSKKRELPRIVGAPRADDAPVEGREIVPKDYGYTGPVEIDLEALMQELLKQQGGGGEGGEGGAGGAPGAGGEPGGAPGAGGGADVGAAGTGDEGLDPAAAMKLQYGERRWGGAQGTGAPGTGAPGTGADPAGAGGDPTGAGADEELDPAAAMKLKFGDRRWGDGPRVEVEVEQQVVESDEEHEVSEDRLKQEADRAGVAPGDGDTQDKPAGGKD